MNLNSVQFMVRSHLKGIIASLINLTDSLDIYSLETIIMKVTISFSAINHLIPSGGTVDWPSTLRTLKAM